MSSHSTMEIDVSVTPAQDLPQASSDAVFAAYLEIYIISARIVTALRHLPRASNLLTPLLIARWNCGLTRELVSSSSVYIRTAGLSE